MDLMFAKIIWLKIIHFILICGWDYSNIKEVKLFLLKVSEWERIEVEIRSEWAKITVILKNVPATRAKSEISTVPGFRAEAGRKTLRAERRNPYRRVSRGFPVRRDPLRPAMSACAEHNPPIERLLDLMRGRKPPHQLDVSNDSVERRLPWQNSGVQFTEH